MVVIIPLRSLALASGHAGASATCLLSLKIFPTRNAESKVAGARSGQRGYTHPSHCACCLLGGIRSPLLFSKCFQFICIHSYSSAIKFFLFSAAAVYWMKHGYRNTGTE